MATMSMAIEGKLDKKSIKARIITTQMRIKANQVDKHKEVITTTNTQIRIITMILMKI
jgi:hypothetical protein